ncbi:MAG: hypothetical protein ACR2I2_12705 [Bryobacteraceae bacterium]
MNRRSALKLAAGGATGLAASIAAAPGPLQAPQAATGRGMPPVKITDLKVILTQPAGDQLVIVKLMTNEPGLYGLGCATHRERPLAVATALEQYMKPFVMGRNVEEIEDIWQSAYLQSYFRSGVTLNNALSGVDGALWDIMGKRAGMPVYNFLGGKVRAAVPLYCHAAAREMPDLVEQVQKWQSQGYRHVRVQLAVPGFSGYGIAAKTSDRVLNMRPRESATRPFSNRPRTSITPSKCSINCGRSWVSTWN